MPGQAVAGEGPQRLGVEPGEGAPQDPGVLLQEGGRQERDVLAPLAQRRQRHREDVEPVEEVLAEPPGRHLGLEVAVGGGDDADVHRQRHVLADPADLLLLQDPVELDLHRQRQVADLVEEDGAAVGLLEEAALQAGRAGEGAAGVAEELALHELGRQGAAVDRHEAAVLAGAPGVDGPGRQLLAGAGLAGEQHRDVERAGLLEELVDLPHRRAAAHQGVEPGDPAAAGRAAASPRCRCRSRARATTRLASSGSKGFCR